MPARGSRGAPLGRDGSQLQLIRRIRLVGFFLCRVVQGVPILLVQRAHQGHGPRFVETARRWSGPWPSTRRFKSSLTSAPATSSRRTRHLFRRNSRQTSSPRRTASDGDPAKKASHPGVQRRHRDKHARVADPAHDDGAHRECQEQRGHRQGISGEFNPAGPMHAASDQAAPIFRTPGAFMHSRRCLLLAFSVGVAVVPFAAATEPRSLVARTPQATAITQVFGDGPRLVAVALDYRRPVRGQDLSTAAFRVENRTVTRVYASKTRPPGTPAENGRYVIVELSPDDPAAVLKEGGPGDGSGGKRSDSGVGAPGGDAGAITGPPPGMAAPKFKPAVTSVTQIAPVAAASGRRRAPSGNPVVKTQVRNLLVDEFRQHLYRDGRTGDLLKYNLFVPRGYDPSRSYPLVLFMHDAGATSDDPLTTLRQGLGAVVWASPADQAKRPCFVLAPQYSSPTVNDHSEATSMLDTTVSLVNSLVAEYRIDRNRLYTTGQSGGAMMSIAMGIKYPDLFAASYLVAGQWDPAKVEPLASARLWIVVSQGDLKAYPGENAITATLEAKGAKVARAVWDGRSTPQQFAAAVNGLETQDAPINYVVLAKGTVVPPEQADDGGSNHINTWRIAYAVEGIRAWMFRQRREPR